MNPIVPTPDGELSGYPTRPSTVGLGSPNPPVSVTSAGAAVATTLHTDAPSGVTSDEVVARSPVGARDICDAIAILERVAMRDNRRNAQKGERLSRARNGWVQHH